MERRDFLRMLGIGSIGIVGEAYATAARFPPVCTPDQTEEAAATDCDNQDAIKLAELVLTIRRKGIQREKEKYHKSNQSDEYGFHIVEVAFTRRGGWDTRIKVENYENVSFAPPSAITIRIHRDAGTKFRFLDEGLDSRCNEAEISMRKIEDPEWMTYFGMVPKPEWSEGERNQQLYQGTLKKLLEFYQKK